MCYIVLISFPSKDHCVSPWNIRQLLMHLSWFSPKNPKWIFNFGSQWTKVSPCKSSLNYGTKMKLAIFLLIQLSGIYIALAFTYPSTNASPSPTNNSEKCLKLGDCQSLQLLLQSKDRLPNMSRIDVYRHIRDLGCGFSGFEPLVKCPLVEGK